MSDSSYSQFVYWMKLSMIGAAGLLIVFLLVLPQLSFDSETISLDIPKVNVKNPSLFKIQGAKFFGSDKTGKPFSIEIKKAVERDTDDDYVLLDKIEGEISFGNERWGGFYAAKGRYYKMERRLTLLDNVMIVTADGYQLEGERVDIYFRTYTANSREKVVVHSPFGKIEAEGFSLDQDHTLLFTGKIQAVMAEGLLK